jgi:hypothetical protein
VNLESPGLRIIAFLAPRSGSGPGSPSSVDIQANSAKFVPLSVKLAF